MQKRAIKFHPDFVHELAAIILYYQKLSEDASSKFKLAVEDQLLLIEENPLYRSVRFYNVRFARIEKFPHVIHYSIEDGIEEVLIHRIVSYHQNSETHWIKKW